MLNSEKKGISRRTLIKTGLILASACLYPLPKSRAEQKAGELRIIMSGGSWKEWVEECFIGPFAKANDIKIIWKLGLGLEPLIMAQRKRPQWDIIQTSQARATQLGNMGLYRKFEESSLPNLVQIHPSFRYDYLAGKCHTPYGLCVNTKKITQPIDSWLNLWDPAFKGRVAFPAWGWVGNEVFHAINIALGGNTKNIDPGIAKFKALFKDNDCRIINNVEHARQLLDAEEIWLCPYFDARTEQAAAAGTPVKFTIPKEGGLSWIWNTALIDNRPAASMALADKYTNTTLEAQAQIDFARKTGYPPTNIQAMKNLPADLERLRLDETQLELLRKLQDKIDYVAMFNSRDKDAERWNKEVLAT